MTRFNRFDSIERPRVEGDAAKKEQDLSRFEAEPQPSPTAVPSAEAPPPDRSHARFEDHLAVEPVDDDIIPFRRCVKCQLDESKFQRWCSVCGADLTTPEALQATWAAWNERELAAKEAAKTNLPPALSDAEIAAELAKEGELERQNRARNRLVLGITTAASLGVTLLIPGFCPKVFFGSVTATLFLLQLPASAWKVLGQGSFRGH